jgi:hypothetical protein
MTAFLKLSKFGLSSSDNFTELGMLPPYSEEGIDISLAHPHFFSSPASWMDPFSRLHKAHISGKQGSGPLSIWNGGLR